MFLALYIVTAVIVAFISIILMNLVPSRPRKVSAAELAIGVVAGASWPVSVVLCLAGVLAVGLYTIIKLR